MYLTEVIIDGFKSYASRTVISGFDQKFNAITGLNGSGKSNILDAICFVLGISTLSQVRVTSLSELVYKQGQSRVNRASVTLVFDNSDKSSSPIGYEDVKEITVTRTLVIGGKNKYLINGTTAQVSRVSNLFQSVGLNVNNPHFLIMQGRITKVVNMKPHEMLSLIEEAAGTRMYENKKLSAEKTIAKKQAKVNEIETIAREEISPTLEKLRNDRTAYLQWNNNNSEIERLQRFVVALQFYNSNKIIESMDSQMNQIKDSQEKLQNSIDINNVKKSAIQNKILQLNENMDNEEKQKISHLDIELNKANKHFILTTSQWQNKTDAKKAEMASLKKAQQQTKESQISLNSLENELKAASSNLNELDVSLNSLKEKNESIRSALLGVNSSNNTNNNDAGLSGQLMAIQHDMASKESQIKTLKMKIAELKKEISIKKKEADKESSQHGESLGQIDKLKSEIQTVEEKIILLKNQNKNESVATVEENLKQTIEEHSKARENLDKMEARLSALSFKYNRPSPNFDDNGVKGLIGRLITVNDARNTLAIEQVAGSKLTNVVVDTDLTAKALLEKGKLERRVTLLPLNAIKSKTIPGNILSKANEVCGSDSHLALELIGYEKDVAAAMNYVFGSTLVCPNDESASKAAHHPQVRVKAVTLDGDVHDPNGTISGGSAPKSGSILMQLKQLTTTQNRVKELAKTELVLKEKLATLKKTEENLQKIESNRDMLAHRLSLVTGRLAQSNYSLILAEIEKLESELKTLETQLSEGETYLNNKAGALNEIEKEISEMKLSREGKQQAMENEMKKLNKSIQQTSTKQKEAKSSVENINLQITELKNDIKLNIELEAKATETIESLALEIEELTENVAKATKIRDGFTNELEKCKRVIQANNKEIKHLEQEKAKLHETIVEDELQLKKLSLAHHRLLEDEKQAKHKIQSLLSSHSWISSEKKLFGVSGGDYDFSTPTASTASSRLNELTAAQEKLGRGINKKVMGMYERAESEYSELMKKKEIIERDKSTIEQVIVELDRKKQEALSTTWKRVNSDLASIFSTLLPGANACLAIPEGSPGVNNPLLIDGLELKVAMGGVWKDSLSELSGGQRSLLALSLILALLLFKPAPMYILDEVDAALDLSHTQNIGSMLKAHFPQSQFIVVSLKEGMFNNANVLFRTKFVDGISTVSRNVNTLNSNNNNNNHKPLAPIDQNKIKQKNNNDASSTKLVV